MDESEPFENLKVKDNLYKLWKKCPSDSPQCEILEKNYKDYDSTLRKILFKVKSDYYANAFSRYKTDMKNTWATIRSLVGNKKSKNKLPSRFKLGDSFIEGNKRIADSFNHFFISSAQNLNASSSRSTCFTDYLKRRIHHTFNFTHITTKDVNDAVSALNDKNSAGHDGISMNFVKKISPSIIFPLSVIFNQSISNGIFPKDMKLAKIIPIHKKGDSNIFDNYWPFLSYPLSQKFLKR